MEFHLWNTLNSLLLSTDLEMLRGLGLFKAYLRTTPQEGWPNICPRSTACFITIDNSLPPKTPLHRGFAWLTDGDCSQELTREA